jgi:cell division topological specificity factor
MIEFLKRLFGHQGSSATAKERLRLVLMTDHLELAPEMIEQMKRELVEVISRHVEVDRDHIEVNFERQDRTLALLANIPIISVNRPNGKAESAPSPKPPKHTSSVKAAARNGDTPPTRKRRRRKKSQTQSPASQPA